MLTQFGLDYGLKPDFAILSDTSFQQNFSKAKCIGLAYIHCPDKNGNRIPCELGFLVEDGDYADKFLDSLIAWKEKSGDSKAVDLEFIEYLNGDYLLSISPNVPILIERIIPEHLREHVNPSVIFVAQGKGGMRISENYKDFRDNYVEGRNIAIRYFIVDKNNNISKRSEKYFLKTEFKFYKEGQLGETSLLNPLINTNIKRSRPPKIAKDNEEFIKRRSNKLRYFFPVTFQKLNTERWLEGNIKSVSTKYSLDQITQAVCNLILFERLKQSTVPIINTVENGYDLKIIEYLSENYESYNSYFPETEHFTKQKVERQIRLDEKYFKKRNLK